MNYQKLKSIIFLSLKIINKNGLLILEHNNNYNFLKINTFQEVRKYGKTCFSFFKNELLY